MYNQFFLEGHLPKKVFGDNIQTLSETSRLKVVGERISFLCFVSAAVGAADFKVKLKKYTSATGGVAKALKTNNPYFVKEDGDLVFTKVQNLEPAGETDAFASGLGADGGIFAIDVLASEVKSGLDADYKYVTLEIEAAGVARTAEVIAVVSNLPYEPAYQASL